MEREVDLILIGFISVANKRHAPAFFLEWVFGEIPVQMAEMVRDKFGWFLGKNPVTPIHRGRAVRDENIQPCCFCESVRLCKSFVPFFFIRLYFYKKPIIAA